MLTEKVFRGVLVTSICLFTSACEEDREKPINFSASAVYNNIIPEFVEIKLNNNGDEFICIENSELNGRGGNIVVDDFRVPNVGYPSYILEKDGVYLADGLTVVGPKSARSELVELSKLTDGLKSIKKIVLSVRYFKCGEIFQEDFKPRAHIHKSEWRKST